MFTKPNNIQICLFFCSLNNNNNILLLSNVYKPKPYLHLLFWIVRTSHNTCNLMFTNPNYTHILFVWFILVLKKTLKKVCNVTQTVFVCLFVCCTDYKELNLKPNPNNMFDIFWMCLSLNKFQVFFFIWDVYVILQSAQNCMELCLNVHFHSHLLHTANVTFCIWQSI